MNGNGTTGIGSSAVSDQVRLGGLPGTNPLGFLAALGALTALRASGQAHRLHWDDGPIPHAVLTPAVEPVTIAKCAMDLAAKWRDSPALNPTLKSEITPKDLLKLKFTAPQIREYLSKSRDEGNLGKLAWCLLAEDSLDNSGKAKPTDFYFTAGQQKFAEMARRILGSESQCRVRGNVEHDLQFHWRYDAKEDSLMWDSIDDRIHALTFADPTDASLNPKCTNPGVEALAVLGLSWYPSYYSKDGTMTQGCSGTWKNGEFAWPLWNAPASHHAVRTLLAQVTAGSGKAESRFKWYASWGVRYVMQAQIRRSSQGGYGTFGPPRTVWRRE